MKTILVSYDLNGHESRQAYTDLIDRIKKYSTWAKPLESLWLIKTDDSVSDVRDTLKPYIDENDELLVLDVTSRSWATRGISAKVNDWIKENL